MSATGDHIIHEVLPTNGIAYSECKLMPVLCKPKLLPLKSVTLEKLERMQKESQELLRRQEREERNREEEEEEVVESHHEPESLQL